MQTRAPMAITLAKNTHHAFAYGSSPWSERNCRLSHSSCTGNHSRVSNPSNLNGSGRHQASSRRRGIQFLGTYISEKKASILGKVDDKQSPSITFPPRRVCTARIDHRKQRRIHFNSRMVSSLTFDSSGSWAGNRAVPTFHRDFSAPSRWHDSLFISLHIPLRHD